MQCSGEDDLLVIAGIKCRLGSGLCRPLILVRMASFRVLD